MGINYQEIAKCVASASKDPRYKIGAIVFDVAGNIRSTGYNGAPRGVVDSAERYEKPLKDFYVAHAEENAISQAARVGVQLEGSCMLVWGKPPCATCTRLIIQAGIKSIIIQRPDHRPSRWAESFEASRAMLKEAGIKITYLKDE